MTRTALICVALTVAIGGALADDFVIIRAQAPESVALARVPLVVSTNAASLREAMGIDELPTGALHGEELPSGRPVDVQLDVIGDRAQFAALLPTEPAGEREMRVWLRNAPQTAPEPPQVLSVERDGDAVVIEGPTYEVRHDPAVNAGILSQITFRGTGKVFTPNLNDRVWNRDMGGFNVANDSEARMEVVASGPYMAEVRVSARYLAENGAAPETNPRATYAIRYWAGLPVIMAEANVSQDVPFRWEQLHFLELHYKDDSFLSFAQDDLASIQEFNDDKSGDRSTRWGALIDGPNVLGMTGNTLIYDGISDYGRYLHGPWVVWDTDRVTLDRWLFVSAEGGALQTLDAAADGTIEARGAVVMTEGLLTTSRELSETARQWSVMSNERAMLAGALRWRIALLWSRLEQGQPLDEIFAAARELQALTVDRPAAAASWIPPTDGGKLLLADDGQLGVGLLQTDTGIVLSSLYDMVTGREMLAARSELFRITLTDADRTPASLASSDGWGSWQARTTGTAGSASIVATFERPMQEGLRDITATLTCELSGGESRWSLTLDNSTQWSIDAVTMPELRAVRIGSQLDDTLYVPHGYGRAFPGGNGTRYVGYYPSGSCALPLLLVSDDISGLYLCAHDPGASTRMMHSDRASGDGTPLSIEEPAPDASVAGNDFTTAGEVVIARVDGGWYPATQKYRAWLQANAPWWPEGDPDYGRPDRPTWLDDIAAWVLTGGGPESVVEPTKAFREYMGLPCAVHWYNWHQIPFDNDYPNYFPTREGVTEGVAELQEAGVRVVPYINGRLWDTDTENFQQVGYKYCTRDRDGEPYIEVYGSGEKLAPMCISQQYWRDTLHDIVLRLMTEVGMDGVYMDQIAAARPRLCYDRTHGHPLAGGDWWTHGYWQLLERIQEDAAAVSPEKMLTTESNAEAYARWFDTYLMCNSLGDNLLPLFPAVYGSKVLGFGRYMAREDWDDPQALAQKQGQLFIWGTQLWWSQPAVINHEFAGPWLRDLARLRHSVREFFNEGRMLEPPALRDNGVMVTADWHRRGLSATMPAVIASAWGVADGRILVPMVNVSADEQTVTLQFDPQRYGHEADVSFSVQRIGPDGAADLGVWTGATSTEITLEGVEAAALRLTPRG